jgi:hypothetical protein
MSLSIPAGLHANFLILHLAERSKLLLAIEFDRELVIHVAIAALALVSAPLMSSAPPLKPCVTAEPPSKSEQDHLSSADPSHPGIPLAQEPSAPLSTPGDSEGSQGDRSGGTLVGAAPHGVASGVSTEVNFWSSPGDKVQLQLQQERERLDGPLLAEVRAVLSCPHFWKVLLAFSAAMGACIVYYLLLEEFLDSSGGANLEDSINLLVVAGSFGAIALPASMLLPHHSSCLSSVSSCDSLSAFCIPFLLPWP